MGVVEIETYRTCMIVGQTYNDVILCIDKKYSDSKWKNSAFIDPVQDPTGSWISYGSVNNSPEILNLS